jgi:hypothetical protein
LWSARTCSYLGDALLLVILVLHLAEMTGQALSVALLLLVGDLAPALLAGFAVLSASRARVPGVPLLIIGLAVSSAGNLFTGLAWAMAVAFALQTVRGIGIAAVDVAVTTLLQRAVPPTMLGRVFGNVYGAVGLAAGLSYVLGGLALNVTSARVVFVVAGAGGLLVTSALAVTLVRHTRAHRESAN